MYLRHRLLSRYILSLLVVMRFTSSSRVAYNPFPPIKNIFMRASFFSCLFHFIAHLFRGLAGAYVNPGRFSLLEHSLI